MGRMGELYHEATLADALGYRPQRPTTANAAAGEVLHDADQLVDALLDPDVPRNCKAVEDLTNALVNAVLEWRRAVYEEAP